MPALFEMTVSPLTPESRIAAISSLRNSAKAEPARHDRHAVPQQAGERGMGVGVDFVHRVLLR